MSVTAYNSPIKRRTEVVPVKKDTAMPVLRLAVLAMMTALVFVSNYLRVTIPINIGGNTSFTLANIMCCLSGLLLGPLGGLASGLGSMLFDLTDPRFVSECWITFLTKGAMGLGAGLVMVSAQKRSQAGYLRCLLGAVLGCAIYYALYFTKSYYYNGLLVEGLQPEMALLTLAAKVPASLFNGIIAIAAAPPLCLAIRRALARSHLSLG